MKNNLLLVINPTAGSIDVKSVLLKTEEWSQKFKYNLRVFRTTGKNDNAKLNDLLQSMDFKRVVVAGGDGTINMVALKLIDTEIILGILPCGSANGLATSLNIPKNLDEQLKIALSQNAILIDTISVNGNICIHIADVGINAELIYNYQASKSTGMLGYAKQAIPTLFKSNFPYEFKISLKDKVINRKAVFLAFANAKKYGTGAIVNPKGKINDGTFEVIIYKKLKLIEILKSMTAFLNIKNTSVESYKTKSVSVKCKRPIALQIDGEFIGEFEELSAKIKPKSLRLAVADLG